MTAIRFTLIATALWTIAGLAAAEDIPLRSPVDPLAITADEKVELHLVEIETDALPITDSIAAWEQPFRGAVTSGHENHIDPIDVNHGSVCKCGNKQCHGVCRDPGHPEKPRHDKPGDVDRGDCPPLRYRIADCKRAGNPHCVARWAKCSVDDKYSSWFVGGGAAFFRGRCRKSTEGTWGLDYDGLFGHANNWLTYTRHRKQGGEGAYETDGEPEFVSRAHEILGLGH